MCLFSFPPLCAIIVTQITSVYHKLNSVVLLALLYIISCLQKKQAKKSQQVFTYRSWLLNFVLNSFWLFIFIPVDFSCIWYNLLVWYNDALIYFVFAIVFKYLTFYMLHTHQHNIYYLYNCTIQGSAAMIHSFQLGPISYFPHLPTIWSN